MRKLHPIIWRVRTYALCTLTVIAASCTTNIPMPVAPASRYARLVVFGASLCDTGNFRAAFGLLPPPPYWSGRFTDSELWVEVLATQFGLSAAPSLRGGANYAYAFATSGEGRRQVVPFFAGVPNLLEQIAIAEEPFDGSELVVVWAGLNDGINAMSSGFTGEASQASAVEAAENVARAAALLRDRGARTLLIANLMDMGRLPLFVNSSQAADATAWSTAFNNTLRERLDVLQVDGIGQILRLPVDELFAEWMQSAPGGITELETPAWNSTILGLLWGVFGFGWLADDPSVHFYWDLVHPGAIIHRRLGEAAIAVLSATPEQ